MNPEIGPEKPADSNPRNSHLDPDRDSRFYPSKWDLSSLPDRPNFVETKGDLAEVSGAIDSMSDACAQFFADLQLDPFLDDDGLPSKRDCSIC